MNSVNEVGDRGVILQDGHTSGDLMVGSENRGGHPCHEMGDLIFVLNLDDGLIGSHAARRFEGTMRQTRNPHKNLPAIFAEGFDIFLSNQRLGAEIHGSDMSLLIDREGTNIQLIQDVQPMFAGYIMAGLYII